MSTILTAPSEPLLATLTFNADGLLPVIVQDHNTREILMQAWMNAESITLTLSTGIMHYWSRSRQSLWKKGESSGQTQHVIELYTDCDQDVLLASVEQTGVACHTGRKSCFYLRVSAEDGTLHESCAPLIDPDTLYAK